MPCATCRGEYQAGQFKIDTCRHIICGDVYVLLMGGTVHAQDDWYRRAQLAVEKGDDELAKEALKRRKSNQENADVMKAQLDQQRKAVDQLISNTK